MSRKPSVQILLTDRALQDLRNIESYSIERWGRATADKYIDQVESALSRIAETPELLRDEPDFADSLKFHRVHNHVLICDVQGETVYVVAVLHTSMDVPGRLAKLKPQLLLEVSLLHDKVAASKKRKR